MLLKVDRDKRGPPLHDCWCTMLLLGEVLKACWLLQAQAMCISNSVKATRCSELSSTCPMFWKLLGRILLSERKLLLVKLGEGVWTSCLTLVITADTSSWLFHNDFS